MRNGNALILLLPVAMAAASPAAAQDSDPRAAAVLSEPIRRAVERPVAGGHVWICRETRCEGRAPRTERGQLAACRVLARGARQIVSFSVGDREFSEAELALCNRG